MSQHDTAQGDRTDDQGQTANLRRQITDAWREASAPRPYSANLTTLLDGVATYTLTFEGQTIQFTDGADRPATEQYRAFLEDAQTMRVTEAIMAVVASHGEEAREALTLAAGRLEMLLSAELPDSDHPSATEYVLRRVRSTLTPHSGSADTGASA